MNHLITKCAPLFARLALSSSYLSAVGDRLGLLGSPGDPNIAWGNLENFNAYVGVLNPWAPDGLIPLLGWSATSLEVAFSICLLTGYKVKEASLGSAGLLLTFSTAMALTTGWQSPLNYSVPSAAACALLLASLSNSPPAKRVFEGSISSEEDQTTEDTTTPRMGGPGR